MEGELRLARKMEHAMLLSFYGKLLTGNRQALVRLYVDEDLSPNEIAARCGISRQAAFDAIAQAFRRLDHYEQTLGLAGRFERLSSGLREAADRLRRLPVKPEAEAELNDLVRLIETLQANEEEANGL